jgi:hypothetical protein
LLAKTTVLEIVHAQGQRLQAAAHARAEAVSTRDPEALRLRVPVTSPSGWDNEPEGPDHGADETASASSALIGFPGSPPNPPK